MKYRRRSSRAQLPAASRPACALNRRRHRGSRRRAACVGGAAARVPCSFDALKIERVVGREICRRVQNIKYRRVAAWRKQQKPTEIEATLACSALEESCVIGGRDVS